MSSWRMSTYDRSLQMGNLESREEQGIAIQMRACEPAARSICALPNSLVLPVNHTAQSQATAHVLCSTWSMCVGWCSSESLALPTRTRIRKEIGTAWQGIAVSVQVHSLQDFSLTLNEQFGTWILQNEYHRRGWTL